jgi:hypothetical protein
MGELRSWNHEPLLRAEFRRYPAASSLPVSGRVTGANLNMRGVRGIHQPHRLLLWWCGPANGTSAKLCVGGYLQETYQKHQPFAASIALAGFGQIVVRIDECTWTSNDRIFRACLIRKWLRGAFQLQKQVFNVEDEP